MSVYKNEVLETQASEGFYCFIIIAIMSVIIALSSSYCFFIVSSKASDLLAWASWVTLRIKPISVDTI